jgi:hypothetical protein
MSAVSKVVHDMKIVPARGADDELLYRFTRSRRIADGEGATVIAANDDGCEWLSRVA